MRNRKRWGVAGGLAAVGHYAGTRRRPRCRSGHSRRGCSSAEHLAAHDHRHAARGAEAHGPPRHLERQRGRLQRPVAALRQGRRQLRRDQRLTAAASYALKNVDVGNTIRFNVTAKNADGTHHGGLGTDGRDQSRRRPAAEARPNGCGKASNGSIPIAEVSSPARLLVDQTQVSPSTITFGTTSVTARFHVIACGAAVQGALVYVTAVPYNQFSIPNEQPTGSDGWATLQMNKLGGFPATQSQQLLVMFVRARKSGEPSSAASPPDASSPSASPARRFQLRSAEQWGKGNRSSSPPTGHVNAVARSQVATNHHIGLPRHASRTSVASSAFLKDFRAQRRNELGAPPRLPSPSSSFQFRRIVHMKRLVLSLFSVVAVLVAAGPPRPTPGAAGYAYTISNAAAGNELVVYKRADDGSLTPAGSVSAGGLGTGGGLASQGAVTLTDNGQIVLAVNPGSNSVAAFGIRHDGPGLLNTAPSGGIRPVSVAATRSSSTC